jgi:PAS domain S-box-containing protein
MDSVALRASRAACPRGRRYAAPREEISSRSRCPRGRPHDSTARLKSIIDSAADGIIVIDSHGLISRSIQQAERLFGYQESEVIGRNVTLLMPSPYREEHDTYLARHLATGVQKIIGTGREVTGLHRDGTTFPLHLSVGKMKISGEPKFTGILHDLSTRVRIEEQLRERTSLARLGEMAAVIAHEVKNPLAGVRGAIQVIGSRLPKDSGDARMIGEIVSRIDALDELMKDLLLFARPPQQGWCPSTSRARGNDGGSAPRGPGTRGRSGERGGSQALSKRTPNS